MATIPLFTVPENRDRPIRANIETRYAVKALDSLAEARLAETSAFSTMSDALSSAIEETSTASAMVQSKKDIEAYNEARGERLYDEQGKPMFASLIDDSEEAYREIHRKNSSQLFLPNAKIKFSKEFDDYSAKKLLAVGDNARKQRQAFLEAEGDATIDAYVELGSSAQSLEEMKQYWFEVLRQINRLVEAGVKTPQQAQEIMYKSKSALGLAHISQFIHSDPEGALEYLQKNSDPQATFLSSKDHLKSLIEAEKAVTAQKEANTKQNKEDAEAGLIYDIMGRIVGGEPLYNDKPEDIKLAIRELHTHFLSNTPDEKVGEALPVFYKKILANIPQTVNYNPISAYVINGLMQSENKADTLGALDVFEKMQALGLLDNGSKVLDDEVVRLGRQVLANIAGGSGDVYETIVKTRLASRLGKDPVEEQRYKDNYDFLNKASQQQYGTSIENYLASLLVQEFVGEKGNSTLFDVAAAAIKDELLKTGSRYYAVENVRKMLKARLSDNPISGEPTLDFFGKVFDIHPDVSSEFLTNYFNSVKHLFPSGSKPENMYLVPVLSAYDEGRGTITYKVYFYRPVDVKTGLSNERVLTAYGTQLFMVADKKILHILQDEYSSYKSQKDLLDGRIKQAEGSIVARFGDMVFPDEPKKTAKDKKVEGLKGELRILEKKHKDFVDSLYKITRDGGLQYHKPTYEGYGKEKRKALGLKAWGALDNTKKLAILNNEDQAEKIFSEVYGVKPEDFGSIEEFYKALMPSLVEPMVRVNNGI